MPTYEYACRSCGEHLEVVQSFRDEPLRECPSCSGALRKVFSAAGIIFKGSGYYVTDTRAERDKAASNGKGAKREGAASDTDKSGGATGSEATSSGGDSTASTSGSSTDSGSSESAA